MVAKNFKTALKYVRQDEGGNDDDPRDHGGRTSRGITQREYDSWRKLKGKSTGDVWKATDKEVDSIYHDQYWDPYCDKLPSGVDYCFFDISVNAGLGQAVRQFQKALGVKVDGMMGQVTLEAIRNHDDTQQLIKDISNVRRNWYRNLKQFPIYGKGWLNRVDHCETGALAIYNVEKYEKSITPTPKSKDAEPASTTVSPETSGATTIGTGGLLALLQQFKEMLEPYQGVIKYVSYALLGIAVVSIFYAGWGYYKRSKVNKAM